jgi:hypothetical protein
MCYHVFSSVLLFYVLGLGFLRTSIQYVFVGLQKRYILQLTLPLESSET